MAARRITVYGWESYVINAGELDIESPDFVDPDVQASLGLYHTSEDAHAAMKLEERNNPTRDYNVRTIQLNVLSPDQLLRERK
jgi:hypothetical protein